jgi:hypothetical protein
LGGYADEPGHQDDWAREKIEREAETAMPVS